MSALDYIERAYRDVRLFMQLTQCCIFMDHLDDVQSLNDNVIFSFFSYFAVVKITCNLLDTKIFKNRYKSFSLSKCMHLRGEWFILSTITSSKIHFVDTTSSISTFCWHSFLRLVHFIDRYISLTLVSSTSKIRRHSFRRQDNSLTLVSPTRFFCKNF